MDSNGLASTPPRLGTSVPVLFVEDIDAAVTHYRDVLGCIVDFVYENIYASVSRDAATIHLRCVDDGVSRTRLHSADTIDVYVTVTGVDALYDEMRSAGAKIVYRITTQDYGMREFYVEDLCRNRLGFGERVEPA